MKEEKNIQLKGKLRLYMRWPLFMSVFLIAINLWIYHMDPKAGLVMMIFVLIYIIIACMMYFRNRAMIMKELVEFSAQYGMVQNRLLKEMKIPYALFLKDGRVMWMNDQFEKIVGKIRKDTLISRYMPELNRSIFPTEEDQTVEISVFYKDKEYLAEVNRVSVQEFSENEPLLEIPEDQEFFISVYLQDVTALNQCMKENEEQRLVAGLVYIDNYDELMNSVEEVRQSLLVALIDRKITQYFSKVDGIVKKMDTDKYFIVLKRAYFKQLESDRFSLLEDVKKVDMGNKMPATLSIGLGLCSNNYTKSYNYARVAIDLALARGGDQAVIKSGEGITYYGGKREQTSRNTRVKARVKAEALREFITVNDRILVMGHKMTDVDSFGSAIGIYRAAAALEKKAHIVINDVSTSIRTLYEDFSKDPNYPDDMFVNSATAKSMVKEHTLVVVVDTNRPIMTECPELLNMTKTIVVLDHHRQSSDNIDALLSYVEPYASSACEMVSEILQYIVEDIQIPVLEVNSLYAGITVDTNSFMNRTGVRTFEAAAFLRRCGAELPYVRRIFRDDIESYRAKATIISNAEVYKGKYAISKGENLDIESPTIIGAQAANELLDIDKIQASFVATTYKGRIYVSARSIDEINVQVLMEKLGGGGHLNASGAQFDHTDLDLAIKNIKRVIDEMTEGGHM